MKRQPRLLCPLGLCLLLALPSAARSDELTLNRKDTGYRGIWYMNQPSGDEYVYKYSGGLGTYCADHQPFAVYRPEVEKTFFVYGGAAENDDRRLWHMISYFDHKTKNVPRPTILLDKKTDDAHDNPVLTIDEAGYLWVFSTSHGTSRPSYIHRSRRPYDIDAFELIPAMRQDENGGKPVDNFSYMQAWHQPGHGFLCFFTKYNYPAARTNMFMSSSDGVNWSQWQRLAAIEEGHYQVSAVGQRRAGAAFNYHPKDKGLNWRTNVYYQETPDFGTTWQAAGGSPLTLPLTTVENPALVHDYRPEGLNVYIMDLVYDGHDRPVILYLTSKGYESGPKNDPRTWTTARWTGQAWDIRPAFTSDNNYDMGSLWIESDGSWRILGPTETGPQAYNPGGEVVLWVSRDEGQSWTREKQLTKNSPHNHTYVRRPVNAHPDFYALWADGHGRRPSPSSLYFCTRDGATYRLPRTMTGPMAAPEPLAP